MFIQYYKYHKRYHSAYIVKDPRLTIVYPADEHAMITAEHDFYVIGTFDGIKVEENAILKIELSTMEENRVVRTITTDIKDNRAGMNIFYEGIESDEPEEVLRSSGMPDLVYDPNDSESFWYTWNKAYYTDHVFSALVYGGSYDTGRIFQKDQNGERLKALKEGEYRLSVTLYNGKDIVQSVKTILLATGQKEIILSRFCPEEHVALVEQFAEEEGFETFTDPYAGIWDTQYFSVDWPVRSYVEIPEKWHWGDAQEYQTGKVHFFNYNISEPCVSYEVELGTMLAGDPECADLPDRLTAYYYHNGGPDGKVHSSVWEQISAMDTGKYLFATNKQVVSRGKQKKLLIESVSKVLPVRPVCLGGCRYQIPDRVATLDYHLFLDSETEECGTVMALSTGVTRKKEDGSEEELILQSQHEIELEDDWAGHRLRVYIEAKDFSGKIWDRTCFEVTIPEEQSVHKAG